MKTEAVLTEIGKIWGRDAIYLDSLQMLNEATFQLKGEITSSENKLYSITFSGVHLFKIIELDYDTTEYTSSFDKVIDSIVLTELIEKDKAEHIGKIDNNYNHYIFRTYDSVFEVICKEYELSLSNG